MFAQPPRTDCSILELLEAEGLVDEADLPDDLIEQEPEDVPSMALQQEISTSEDLPNVPSTSASSQCKRISEVDLLQQGASC